MKYRLQDILVCRKGANYVVIRDPQKGNIMISGDEFYLRLLLYCDGRGPHEIAEKATEELGVHDDNVKGLLERAVATIMDSYLKLGLLKEEPE